MKPYIMGETDDVTMDECLHAVSAAINHNTAKNILVLEYNLEKFRNTSLPLDMTISFGDVIVTHEYGSRSYGLKAEKLSIDIKNKTV